MKRKHSKNCVFCGCEIKGGTGRYGFYFCNKEDCNEKGWQVVFEIDNYFIGNTQRSGRCGWPLYDDGEFCQEPAMEGSVHCKKHTHKCAICGKPATRECHRDIGIQFMCGEWLCDHCGCPRSH